MKNFLALCSLLFLFSCAEKAVSLNGEYQMADAPENAEITITLDENKFSGRAAVNRYFGSFTTEGNAIKFSPAGSTMMAGPENLMKIEQQFLQDLDRINHYQLKNGMLILSGSDNLVWKFIKQ